MKQSPYLCTASLGLGVSVRTVCTQELPRARELTVGCGSLEAWPRTDRRWRGVLVVLRRVHICDGGGVRARVALGLMFRVEEDTVPAGEHRLPSLAARPRGRR